ncbi:MAG: hypothetical protein MZU95_04130 [Desulfomicrobium escambiense]|nr:hypothetical protein [Desulfomicrobium escambiense]
MNIEINNTPFKSLENKICFVGISVSSAAANDTGIAVIDKDLNLLGVDKVYNLNDLQEYIKRLSPLPICLYAWIYPETLL